MVEKKQSEKKKPKLDSNGFPVVDQPKQDGVVNTAPSKRMG
jgi:hypothetical protein